VAARRLFSKVRNRLGLPREYKFTTHHARFPVIARSHTSDLEAFAQVFAELQYRPIVAAIAQHNVDMIVDAGANVGYASAYFLSQLPECRILAIEPDFGNYEVLVRNLSPYGERAHVLHAALWSSDVDLVLRNERFRDGREWSRQVRACNNGEKARVHGIGMNTVLEKSGRSRVSLLKIDIEGAEREVFSQNLMPWIDRVDAIAIELHEDSVFGPVKQLFAEAIAGRFIAKRFGELTWCERVSQCAQIE